MCAYSMIVDHYYDKWQQHQQYPLPSYYPIAIPATPAISQQEIEEFRQLLDRAREYDKRTGQADCELEEKKERVRKLAAELGVRVDFL